MSICKNSLHFSIGLCIAADIAGDIGIIGYHSIEKKKEISHAQTEGNVKNAKVNSFKFEFNPIDFSLSIGLMAIILIVI